MLRAKSAQVHWDDHKKHWTAEIRFGGEVIKRPVPHLDRPAAPDELKSQVVAIGRDEGYDVDPAQVVVQS
jgi:hypothetical protein